MRVVSASPRAELKDFKKVTSEDRHNIQTHVDYLSMLVRSGRNTVCTHHQRFSDSGLSELFMDGQINPYTVKCNHVALLVISTSNWVPDGHVMLPSLLLFGKSACPEYLVTI